MLWDCDTHFQICVHQTNSKSSLSWCDLHTHQALTRPSLSTCRYELLCPQTLCANPNQTKAAWHRRNLRLINCKHKETAGWQRRVYVLFGEEDLSLLSVFQHPLPFIPSPTLSPLAPRLLVVELDFEKHAMQSINIYSADLCRTHLASKETLLGSKYMCGSLLAHFLSISLPLSLSRFTRGMARQAYDVSLPLGNNEAILAVASIISLYLWPMFDYYYYYSRIQRRPALSTDHTST